MGLTENIWLWTISLMLAVVGIAFGIIASMNSHKANLAVKELVASSWIADESEKIFYKNLKELLRINNKVTALLKATTTFKHYSIVANGTRLTPINTRSFTMLKETEFKEIVKKYRKYKKEIENDFSTIITDFAILGQTKKIPVVKRKELGHYHQKITKFVSEMIGDYTKLINHGE